ncbi:hypothetical protein HORM4_750052 [Vibrio harveyi]|nr:hypothetical protein HORM4_750052 [Vibrio harveyi]
MSLLTIISYFTKCIYFKSLLFDLIYNSNQWVDDLSTLLILNR